MRGRRPSRSASRRSSRSEHKTRSLRYAASRSCGRRSEGTEEPMKAAVALLHVALALVLSFPTLGQQRPDFQEVPNSDARTDTLRRLPLGPETIQALERSLSA